MSTPDLLNLPAALHTLPEDTEQLQAAASKAGLACHVLDLSGCTSLLEAVETLATALQFPDWFGHNLDALMDCLTDLSWLPAPGQVLLLTGTASPAAADPQGFATLLEILTEATRTWAENDVPFWVFADAPDLPTESETD